MEGSYYKLFTSRAVHADVIIFLDTPRYLCLWRVIKRSVCNLGKVTPGNPKDCKQQLFSFKFLHFLHWIWNFNRRYKAMILDILEMNKDSKNLYILKSAKDIDNFISKLPDN
jgi:adenylate kinase family enzyme